MAEAAEAAVVMVEVEVVDEVPSWQPWRRRA